MEINGWRYYKYMMLPTTVPHEVPNLEPIRSKAIFKEYKKAFVAKYSTDWDIQRETNWWYVIKDTPFDVSTLKAKRRYEINKGLKNFDIRRFDVHSCPERLYEIMQKAYATWPSKYRPSVDYEKFIKGFTSWDVYIAYGAYSKADGSLCGYALLQPYDGCLDFCVLRVIPEMENLGINAALVAGLLEDQREFLCSGGYISDGSRSVMHETAFQDYLEKYFDFRKAYCKLNMVYSPIFAPIVRVLYPFRRVLSKLDKISAVSKISAILTLEEIAREQKE